MKTGILTLPLHTNYGGILQAYALQTVLERLGHEVILIEKKRKSGAGIPVLKLPLVYAKRVVKNMLGRPVPILFEQKVERERPIIGKYTAEFIERHIHRVVVDEYSDLESSGLGTIVVGSDQIWRPPYFSDIENAYLKFAKDWDIKRVAYAASFGTEEWEYTKFQQASCATLAARFDAVSVREDSGVRLCREHLGVDALHVLDPTMLLEKEDYVYLVQAAGTKPCDGNLLTYILDETEETDLLVNKVSGMLGLKPFRSNSKVEDYNAPIEERIQPPVEYWLRGFMDAEFVVTDSFHACVFSIIFRKQFVVIGNKGRGMSRFESLLSMFGLGDRMVASAYDYAGMKEIDYDAVYEKYGRMKETSLGFLSKIK